MPAEPFSGRRLEVARTFAGLNQTALAERVGITQGYVCQLEQGAKTPAPDLRAALAVATGFAPEFFEVELDSMFELHECTFRRRKRTPVEIQKRLAASGSIFSVVLSYLLKRLKVPEVDLPEHKAVEREEIERTAEKVRMKWGLGLDRPLTNVVRAAELHGIVTTRFDASSEKVDAFSRHGSPRPVIVLNLDKQSASRTRFSVAHEIGHLVLHKGERASGDDDQEDPADAFASAFLMPRAGFLRGFPHQQRVDWTFIFRLKAHWKASAAAIVRRAYELGRIDAIEYRRAYKHMSASGWLKGEPDEPPDEAPEIIPKGIAMLAEKRGETLTSIARRLGMSVATIIKVTGIEASSDSAHETQVARRDNVLPLRRR